MGKKLLVVDDDAGIRTLLSNFFNDEGYEVLAAADGREALEVNEAENPDLILLDISMPEIDGVTVLKTIGKTRSKPPVIMITGDSETKRVNQLLKLGACEYILKPFDLENLKEKVSARLKKNDC